MVMKSDYQREGVNICLSVLIELMTILGSFRENAVLIGGWTPWFLIPEKRNEHTGSLDIDIALDFKRIDSAGPVWVANFLEITDDEEKERIQRDAYERVNALIMKVEIPSFEVEE